LHSSPNQLRKICNDVAARQGVGLSRTAMIEASFRGRWLIALIAAGSLGCGKVTRDDAARAVPVSAGTNSAFEPSSGGAPAASAGTASAGSPSLPSATGGEAGCGPLIDDLESGSGHICEGNGLIGVWYAFNDMKGEQWPAVTTPGVPIAISEIPGGRGASTRAIHTYGKGFYLWGAGVGVDFAFDGVSYGSFDASAYDGIRFWARSEAPQKLLVRIGTRSTKVADYGGTCAREPCDPHAQLFDVGASWVELSLPFNDIKQIGPHSAEADFLRDELTHLQFMPQTQPFDFWIDDVRFYRDRDCCSHPLWAVRVRSSFPTLRSRSGFVARRASGKGSCVATTCATCPRCCARGWPRRTRLPIFRGFSV
jgi:hypothetical protein